MSDHSEYQALLHGLLDGELDAANALRCEEHLAGCPACTAQYKKMSDLRDAIRGADLRYRAPQHLKEKVTASIKGAEPRRAIEIARRVSWPAATLLAACLGFFALLPRAPDISEELVSSHVRSLMANHLTDVASSDHHTVKPWFAGHIDFSPPIYDLAAQGYPLVGGRVDYVDGHPVAALVYRRGEHVINLFISPQREGGAGPVLAEAREGYNILHWTKLGMNCWAVSDLNAQEMQYFERLVKTQSPV
jgi:anti-sigma factor RsiW